MQRKIAVFDVDNTIVDGFTEKIFAQYLFWRGQFPPGLFIDLLFWFIKYKLNFKVDLVGIRRKMFSLFGGHGVAEVAEIFSRCFSEKIKPRIFPEAIRRIRKHQEMGYEIVLISASLEPLILELRGFLGVKYSIATKLSVVNGYYDGNVEGEIIYGGNKVYALTAFAEANGFTFSGSYVYCDHISDLPVMEICEHPIAINPGKQLKKIAEERRWEVVKISRNE